MAKNRKFKNGYVVTVEGVTTNGFQAKLFDDILRGICTSIGVNSQQTKIDIKVIATEGDWDAEIRKFKPELEIKNV